ncbi:hypothetical protein GCM10020000_36450 [Streptomyces olivoverticillatus]
MCTRKRTVSRSPEPKPAAIAHRYARPPPETAAQGCCPAGETIVVPCGAVTSYARAASA